MTNERAQTELPSLKGRIGHDVGDVCDRIWANAAKAALRHSSKTEPVSRLGAPRECRLSQEEEGNE
jgi:hypothetical protein